MWGAREPQLDNHSMRKKKDMWEFWEENDKYIQGNLVSEHSSKAAAISRAKKKLGKEIKLTEDNRKNEKIIWIDSPTNIPLGIIRKLMGAKRIRQSKKG